MLCEKNQTNEASFFNPDSDLFVELIEDIEATILHASAKDLAGLISGRNLMFMTTDYEVHVLNAGAEDDGAFRQCFGRLYDLAVNDIEQYGDDFEFLKEAISIVGVPSGYEDMESLEELEEDCIADKVRASAIEASPEFAERCRLHLMRFINRDYCAGVLDQMEDDQE